MEIKNNTLILILVLGILLLFVLMGCTFSCGGNSSRGEMQDQQQMYQPGQGQGQGQQMILAGKAQPGGQKCCNDCYDKFGSDLSSYLYYDACADGCDKKYGKKCFKLP